MACLNDDQRSVLAAFVGWYLEEERIVPDQYEALRYWSSAAGGSAL